MHPRLVLLDEPSQGLAPRIVEDIMAVIEEMRAERIAILLVEQNSAMALSLADRAYVIDDGRIVHAASGGRAGRRRRPHAPPPRRLAPARGALETRERAERARATLAVAPARAASSSGSSVRRAYFFFSVRLIAFAASSALATESACLPSACSFWASAASALALVESASVLPAIGVVDLLDERRALAGQRGAGHQGEDGERENQDPHAMPPPR